MDKIKVGQVAIYEAVEYVDNSYETAAWYKAWKSETGFFDLFLIETKDGKRLYYELPAVCTGSNFQGLWGGVPISRDGKGINEDVGEVGVIKKQLPLDAAVLEHWVSIDEEHVDAILDELKAHHTAVLQKRANEIAMGYAPNALNRTGPSHEAEGTYFDGKYDEFRIGWASVGVRQMENSVKVLESITHCTATDRHANMDECHAAWKKDFVKRKETWKRNMEFHENQRERARKAELSTKTNMELAS